MEMPGIDSPGAAFVAGLVTSLHCAGMCGPLACWLTPTKADDDAATVYSVYHGTRLLAYGILGALAGAIGKGPLALVGEGALRYVPWALVVFFVAVALRWDKKMPKSGYIAGLWLKVQGWLRGRSRLSTAAVLGTATPLMPCGPLYFVAALAALSGSALKGVEFMVAFGLGTMPLLWAVQSNFGWLRLRLSPVWISRLQVALALAAALVISWRLRGTIGFDGVTENAHSCCH
ncbi:MAG: sulfite exporter TauE/SafE family protein [Nibricoccus sp.]